MDTGRRFLQRFRIVGGTDRSVAMTRTPTGDGETTRERPGRSAGLLVAALAGQGLLALLVLAMLAVGGVAWRLSSGPIDAAFLIGTIEGAMSDELVNLDIGRMQLEWRDFDQPLILVAEDVSVTGPEGTAMASLPAMEVTLSHRALLGGRIAPASLSVIEPRFAAERLAEGGFEIVLGPAEHADLLPPTDIVITLLNSLLAPPGTTDAPMSEIERLTVRDARVDLIDHHSRTEWIMSGLSIDLERGLASIAGGAAAVVSGPGGMENGWLTADIGFDMEAGETALGVTFGGIVPAVVARLDDTLAPLAAIRSPIDGRARTTLSPDGHPQAVEFRLDGDAAVLDIPGLYDAPMSVAGVTAQGTVDFGAGRLNLPNIGIDIGGPVLVAGLSAISGRGRGDEFAIDLNVRATDLPLDFLPRYWPTAVAPKARDWVTANITRGIVDEATLTLDTTVIREDGFSEGASWRLAEDAGEPPALTSMIRFSGATLTYLDDLPPITGLSGAARYADGVFSVETGGGRSAGLSADAASIEITGFDRRFQTIDIDLVTSGPLSETLDFLGRPRLGFTDDIGIDMQEVGGSAVTRLRFGFPLRAVLRMDHVSVAGSSEITGASMVLPGLLPGSPSDLRVDAFDGRLSVDGQRLALSGNGVVAGQSLDFAWSRGFDEGSPDRLEVQGALDAETLAALLPDGNGGAASGVTWSTGPGGVAPLSVAANFAAGGRVTADVEADIADLGIAVQGFDITKPPGVPGTVSGRVTANAGGLSSLDRLALETMGLSFQGSLGFSGGEMRTAVVERLVHNGSRLAGRFERTAEGGISGRLTGEMLDLSSMLGGDGETNDPEAPGATARLHDFLNGPVGAGEGMDIAFDLDGVRLPEGGTGAVTGRIVRTAATRRVEIDGTTAGGLPFDFQAVREGAITRISGAAQQLGGVLAAFGIHDGLTGGSLELVPTTGSDGAAEAILDIRNVRVVHAPVLARLLAAMSVGGLTDLLGGGGGLPFDSIQARLRIENGRVQISDATASGGALGLTANGWIDLGTGTMSVAGDVIPIAGVNEVIRSIPLVGDLATGGTDAVFAFTYRIAGALDQPSVVVNPLSVLAPGVLRRLFTG